MFLSSLHSENLKMKEQKESMRCLLLKGMAPPEAFWRSERWESFHVMPFSTSLHFLPLLILLVETWSWFSMMCRHAPNIWWCHQHLELCIKYLYSSVFSNECHLNWDVLNQFARWPQITIDTQRSKNLHPHRRV